MSKFVCPGCEYVYDEDRGDPGGGLSPGTPLVRAEQEWRCPRCGRHGQVDFVALEQYDDSNDLDS